MLLNNRTIQINRAAAIQDLRKQLQALEEDGATFEKHKEDDKELAEAIAMSETAASERASEASEAATAAVPLYLEVVRLWL